MSSEPGRWPAARAPRPLIHSIFFPERRHLLAVSSPSSSPMALASTTASRLIARRLAAPLPPSSSSSSPSSALRRAAPRGGARPRGVAVRWEGRPRALLGGFSDADADYPSDDEDEDEEDARSTLSGGPSPPHLECDDVLDLAAAASSGPERWDVLGLGQAMVDFSGMVDDEFLERLGIEKGTRKVVNHEERGRVLRAMDGCTYKAAAGGSLSNSLVALARLGSSRITSYPELRIAMAGSVGSDPLGSFYRQKLQRANVQFLSKPVKDGTTGTVIVLTTPDAQRTMLAYQGTSSTLAYDSDLAELVSKSNLLVVEGYLFEFAHTIEAIKQACEDAKKNGALIAVSASDVSCIKRCHSDFWDIVGNYADILFANANEARAFCELTSEESTMSAARYLSHSIPLVSVTDGMHGSYIGVKGEAIYIPPPACIPVDTCGAGDAYASGILYGILRGASDLKGIGLLAAQVAAVVVGQQGTRLRVKDADRLAESFEFHFDNLEFCSDAGTDQIPNL